MARKGITAQSVQSKWQQNFGNSGEAWAAGVQAVQGSPTAMAAASADLWAANTTAAKARFVAKLQAISGDQWKQMTIAKGKARLTDGASAGAVKYGAFITKFLPGVQQIVANAGPRGNYAQNRQRLLNVVDALHASKGTWS